MYIISVFFSENSASMHDTSRGSKWFDLVLFMQVKLDTFNTDVLNWMTSLFMPGGAATIPSMTSRSIQRGDIISVRSSDTPDEDPVLYSFTQQDWVRIHGQMVFDSVYKQYELKQKLSAEQLDAVRRFIRSLTRFMIIDSTVLARAVWHVSSLTQREAEAFVDKTWSGFDTNP